MKYVVIILSGAADEPVEALDGRTPLEVASIPNLTRLASRGRVGAALTVPDDLPATPEVAVLSILGYDSIKHRVARAPLEAAAMGIELDPREWILRVSLVTVGEVAEEAGLLVDAAPEGLTEREARVLLTDLLGFWRGTLPELARGLTLATGTGKRLMLIDASSAAYHSTITQSADAVWQEPVREFWPSGGAEATRLRKLMEASQPFLNRHEVNLARSEQGLRPANLAWIWGQGAPVKLPRFEDVFKVRPVMFTGDEAIGGLAVAVGMDRLSAPPGREGDALGLAALAGSVTDTLRRRDLVCCYLEDLATATDPHQKIAILEEVDAKLVGPLVRELDEFYADPSVEPSAEGWRVLVISDCVKSTDARRMVPGAVPFVMTGAWIRSVMERPFTEESSMESDLQISPGHDLMEYFLRGGLASVRARTR